MMQRAFRRATVALLGPLALSSMLRPQGDGCLLASRRLPPPSGASSELRARLEKLPAPDRRVVAEATPEDRAGWEALQAARDTAAGEVARGLAQALAVSVEKDEIGGVPAFRLRPDEVEPENEGRLFLHVHGGAYVLNGGEAAITEGLLIASRVGIPVASVDYRMPPAHPFPAALDDVVAVYTSLLGDRPARSIRWAERQPAAASSWWSCTGSSGSTGRASPA